MQTDLKEKNLTNWVNQFADDLLSWAIFKVSDTQLAQDLVQDTFLAASDKEDKEEKLDQKDINLPDFDKSILDKLAK